MKLAGVGQREFVSSWGTFVAWTRGMADFVIPSLGVEGKVSAVSGRPNHFPCDPAKPDWRCSDVRYARSMAPVLRVNQNEEAISYEGKVQLRFEILKSRFYSFRPGFLTFQMSLYGKVASGLPNPFKLEETEENLAGVLEGITGKVEVKGELLLGQMGLRLFRMHGSVELEKGRIVGGKGRFNAPFVLGNWHTREQGLEASGHVFGPAKLGLSYKTGGEEAGAKPFGPVFSPGMGIGYSHFWLSRKGLTYLSLGVTPLASWDLIHKEGLRETVPGSRSWFGGIYLYRSFR